MPDPFNEVDFTQYVINQLKPLNIPIKTPTPLLLELHYGDSEPVLAVPLKSIYMEYLKDPAKINDLIEPYRQEISWTAQPPRYQAVEIFETTMPLMKDVLIEPIAQDGETVKLHNKEIVLRLPKGPVLFQELVKRPDEHLVVQFIMDKEEGLIELARGDVLSCFPEPTQIARIAIQNLAKSAIQSGLTTRPYKIENFKTEILQVSLREPKLAKYVASLVNISEVILTLEENLHASDGLLAIIPTRDQMFVSTHIDEESVCEMGLLANFIKTEALKMQPNEALSTLVWRFKDGELTSLQTVKVEDDE